MSSTRKYPRSNEVSTPTFNGPAYYSWDDSAGMQKAFANYDSTLDEFVSASISSRTRDYSGLTTYLSGKPGLTNQDFSAFRSGSNLPVKPKDIIATARAAYKRIGLLRNAIDLMGDFTCQGIRLVHKNPTIQRFMNDWFDRVDGPQLSERVCNLLFREANVIAKMRTASLNPTKRKKMQKSLGEVDLEANIDILGFKKNEVPWQYEIIDPLVVEPIGGMVASMVQKRLYGIKLPQQFKMEVRKLMHSQKRQDREILSRLPKEIMQAASDNSSNALIALPEDKTFVMHYKKDSWQLWAEPMSHSCLTDLQLYEQLKLADRAALDGAVSKIRVWKIGSLEHKLAPTPTASSALGQILGSSVGGGVIDVVWGPDIELIETSADLQSFLGEEKYRPTLMAIYACLGIPPTLTGTFGASGTTNNYISLKTLTERLNYVRRILVDFWNHQLKIVQKAMGFRFPATVEFDFMYLDDPASMANLLLNMSDRNIVSHEFVQRQIKADPSIEGNRVSNEEKDRERKGMEKISPYHTVDKEFHLKKIALQTGVSAPSEVGLELEDKKSGEKPALEMRQPTGVGGPGNKTQTKSPSGNRGRPKNTPDSGPRKPKKFTPKTKAAKSMWAREAQNKISKVVSVAFLTLNKKSNLRRLTAEETNKLEQLKFETLCKLHYSEELTEENIMRATVLNPIPNLHSEFNKWIFEAQEELGRKPNMEETRALRASFYAEFME